MEAIPVIVHAFITILAVIGLAIRIEHRLTIIETDMKWIKQNVNNQCQGATKYEEN